MISNGSSYFFLHSCTVHVRARKTSIRRNGKFTYIHSICGLLFAQTRNWGRDDKNHNNQEMEGGRKEVFHTTVTLLSRWCHKTRQPFVKLFLFWWVAFFSGCYSLVFSAWCCKVLFCPCVWLLTLCYKKVSHLCVGVSTETETDCSSIAHAK